jgi:hypothetical protein
LLDNHGFRVNLAGVDLSDKVSEYRNHTVSELVPDEYQNMYLLLRLVLYLSGKLEVLVDVPELVDQLEEVNTAPMDALGGALDYEGTSQEQELNHLDRDAPQDELKRRYCAELQVDALRASQ